MRFSKAKVEVIFTVVFLMFSVLDISTANAQVQTSVKRLATCSTIMDNFKIKIDLFRDTSGNTKSGDYGYWTQSLEVYENQTKIKPIRGNLEITEPTLTSEQNDSYRIILYAFLEPEVVFSIIDLPKTLNKTKIDIVKPNSFLWGTLTCDN